MVIIDIFHRVFYSSQLMFFNSTVIQKCNHFLWVCINSKSSYWCKNPQNTIYLIYLWIVTIIKHAKCNFLTAKERTDTKCLIWFPYWTSITTQKHVLLYFLIWIIESLVLNFWAAVRHNSFYFYLFKSIFSTQKKVSEIKAFFYQRQTHQLITTGKTW